MICYDLVVVVVHIKMSYYQLNKDRLLEKPKYRHHNGGGKEKTFKYYEDNKEVLREKARNKYTDLSEEEKEGKRE